MTPKIEKQLVLHSEVLGNNANIQIQSIKERNTFAT